MSFLITDFVRSDTHRSTNENSASVKPAPHKSYKKYPGERLIACRNPLLAEERSRKRDELLSAAEAGLKQIVRRRGATNSHCAAKTGLRWRWAKRWAGTK
jgi:hypothetical protein